MIFKKRFPHTFQHDSKDCGPACLQMLCEYFGRFFEMDYLRDITGVRKEGISVYDFIKASEKLNLRCSAFRVSYGKFRHEIPLPCVVHWRGMHFVVVYKITPKYVYVSDPALGRVKYTLKEFAQGWLDHVERHEKYGKRGVCIVCEPTASFNKTDETQTKSNYLSALSFMWDYIKPYKKNIVQILCILVVMTVVNAIFPIITQSIIDVGIPSKDYSFLTLLLISTVVLGLSTSFGTWVKQAINMHFGLRVKVGMLSDYLSHLFKLPLPFYESRLMGDLLQRSKDFERMESMIMGVAFNAILAILYLLVFGTILFLYNSTLFWIFFLANLLYVGWVLLFWSIRKKMDIKYFSYLASNNSHWMELLSKILDIKSYNYGQPMRWKWEKIQVGLYKTQIKLLRVDQIQGVGSNLISTVRDAMLIYVAAIAVIDGEMTIGMMIAVQYILGQLKMPVENIINFIISWQLAFISYTRTLEVRKAKPENADFKETEKVIDLSNNLWLNNIYYKYSVNEEYVLKNISLCIPKGKVTALVGESGSGKSTIIKLLMQLYVPSNGYLSSGKLRLSSFSVDAWRERCGIITQESTLLKDTITNNIVFGREFDKEKLLNAISIANVKDEIEAMPGGYDTMIGENGRGVSEGQKQRILFARAIYNEPDYLFLDEVTSALDSRNENSIVNCIQNNLLDKTVVIAAHRLSSVINADNIIVLKKGQVVEVGNHELLMKSKKEYYNLFEGQLNSRWNGNEVNTEPRI
ncbi:MAG: peptidase domain-containing ABC transporter [Bacteroidales bacterium]|nr:peptidase domain-containing ABC transporter [Bacteroidales bacterium]